jgi:hypothetical protein
MIDIEFVTASHNDATLHGQLKRSPIFQKYALTEKKGFNNIPEAYNSLGPISDLTCYVHHDVFLPSSFESDLIKSLDRLPGDWGVIGVAGVRLIKGKKQNQGYILDRGNDWGSMWNLPAEVDTLDEMLLITRGDFVFDEQFPLDFYGADICIQAKAQGKKCYAISAYCEHNSTRKFGERTTSFYESQEKFREKWKNYLPIATTCALVN